MGYIITIVREFSYPQRHFQHSSRIIPPYIPMTINCGFTYFLIYVPNLLDNMLIQRFTAVHRHGATKEREKSPKYATK